MAHGLTAWLHHDIKFQLELGARWLEDKNTAKARLDTPSATAVDSKWIGIYHDNGSCLEIVRPLALDDARVLVLGVRDRPLTITDCRHHAAASLAPACHHDLRTRHPTRDLVAGTLLAIRQYTLRCTAYGPPRDQLQLILDSVDWLGESHNHLSTDPVQPLQSCKDLAPALRRLRDARVLDDDRCLRAQPKQEDLDEASHTMAGADEPLGHDASMSTQMPFDTQIQHPIRSHRNDDDLQFVGVNRLEPVLAGNTQRAELKSRSRGAATVESASIMTQHARLLALIAPRQAPAVPQPQLRPEPSRLEHDAYTTSPWPKETPRKHANRERTDELAAHASQTPLQSDNGRKRMRDVEEASPSTHHSAKKTSFSETEPKHNIARELDRFAAECSWMKGLKFNRESFTVPQDQVNILHKPESWYKPAPGLRHPEANLPTKIFITLSRFEDERVAAEAALEASSGSYNQTDPPASAPPSKGEQEDDSDDEPPTSPVSWQTSPSPEPPQRPASPRQDLPPDSSDEAPADATESVAWQPSAAPAATRHRSPPPTLPPSSTENEGVGPPSSPPAPQTADDSDDEMELDMSVPQALGEDLSLSRPVPNRNAQTETQSKSVVQVKETLYVKGKNGQPVVTISPPTQASNELQHDSSSASIVRGTYHDFSSSLVEETHLDTLCKDNGNEQGNTGNILSAKLDQSHHLPPEHDTQDVAMFDAFVHDEPQPDLNRQVDKQPQSHSKHARILEDAPAQPEPTPMSAQLPPKDSSSGEQAAPGPEDAPAMPAVPTRESSRQSSATASLSKRKLKTTSTKERKRSHTRLKVVGFGSDDTETLRQQHAEAMRRSKSSTSVKSRQESVVNVPVPQGVETKVMAPDVKGMMEPQVAEPSAVAKSEMSPRHQSLYAAPSPTLRASVNLPATVPAIESMDITPMVPDAPEVATRQRPPEHPQLPPVAVLPQPEPKAEHDRVPVQLPEPQPQPGVTRPGPEIRASAEKPPPTAPVKAARPSTVFESFKAAYPEYKGSLKHFRNQCSQMEELDREDRMVPKWMWDDYIIRNSIEYRDYAVECADSGEATMPYIRFYKDTIRDTVYKKGVVETRATLLQALQELDVKPHAAETRAPQPTVQQAAWRSSHQSPRPPVQPATYARQPHQQSVHPTCQPTQQSPRPTQQPTQSPIPSPAQSATPPPHKKPSRKSLPFLPPDKPTPTPATSTPRIRHSLPAHSSRTTPASPSVPGRAPPRRKSRLAEVLKHHIASDAPAVAAEDEFRNFAKAHAALTSATGSTRVNASPARSCKKK
ncbi:hypothetical protein EJ07DRAFT_170891 [Lizonia empirigonia]|nr:hypothetical protein EJ07DRAFT_170891 [Lizonia empirigonia]